MSKMIYNIDMEKPHLLKRKNTKKQVYYVAAWPMPDGLPGYQKMMVLHDAAGRKVSDRDKALELLFKMNEKALEKKTVGTSIKDYLTNFWTESSSYVKSKAVDGKPLTTAYIKQSLALINTYFLPWAEEHGLYSLKQLKRKNMLDWRNDCFTLCREKKLSTAPLNKTRLALSVALAEAANDELIENNPLAGIKRAINEKKPRLPFSVDELKKLFSMDWNNQIKTMAMLAAYLGLRVGECEGLLWEHVHLDTGKLDILKQWQSGFGVGLCDPKCKSIRLDVDIPAILLGKLTAMKASAKSKFVFPGDTPELPISRHYIYKELKAGLAKAGIACNKRLFHSFRHSWVTIASEAVGIDAASETIGHSDVSTTMGYRHIRPDAASKALKSVENALK